MNRGADASSSVSKTGRAAGLVGSLAGTHNGDVEAADLRARFALPPAVGGTDSEVIYQALASGHHAIAPELAGGAYYAQASSLP